MKKHLLTHFFARGHGPAVELGYYLWLEIPPLNAVARKHEEEDGSNHQSNAQLPP